MIKKTETIEELRQWYVEMNLPPEDVTRFFIGKNYKEKRAFGIYQKANGDFVVYKNKDTGERAIRYEGSDEAYAVNELWLRLKKEIQNQKQHNRLSEKTHQQQERAKLREKKRTQQYLKKKERQGLVENGKVIAVEDAIKKIQEQEAKSQKQDMIITNCDLASVYNTIHPHDWLQLLRYFFFIRVIKNA